VIEQPEVAESGSDRDHGFTLVEILVVISMMALLATVMAATVTVVLRTAPTSEVRADDARSLQGLVTWIPEDVDAAPPGGFDTATTAWPCAGPAPANSHNVLSISWTERTGVTNNYAATYRYEFNGSDWHMTRYACNDEATGTMAVGRSHNLTSAMPAWNNLSPPAFVTMCAAKVDIDGQCPAGSEIAGNTSPDVRSLKLNLVSEDGTVSTIDAAPKNPDEDLADDPGASTNATPTLSQSDYVLEMYAGDTVTIDLGTTHNPSDADGDTLSVAIDSSEPMPPGITASTADPLDVTITADVGLAPGTISPPLVLIVSDPRAGWVDPTVTVRIIPEPNIAPTVSPGTYDLKLALNQTVILPLDATHGASDANGDSLTANVVSITGSPSISAAQAGAPNDPLDVEITAKPGAASGDAVSILVSIDDGNGGSVNATINVEIAALSANQDPIVTNSDVPLTMLAGETVTLFLDSASGHGAFDPDGDPLSANLDTIKPQPAGITTVLPGALEVTLTADQSMLAGPITTPVSLEIEDAYGAVVEVTISITIAPTPPPPSDCVLGTLAATPGTADRWSSGAANQLLASDVTVTLTYSGSCDGLVLKYETGDTSGLGVGTGRVFTPGSPASIIIYAKGNGGTEKWAPGTRTLTASTTSDVTPSTISTTLTVT